MKYPNSVNAGSLAVIAKKKFSLILYHKLVFLVFKIQFMAKNTSILLGDHFEKFISKEVSSGRYGSASEVVRTALRILESEEEKKAALIKALRHGEKSKRIKDFDGKVHLELLHKKYL